MNWKNSRELGRIGGRRGMALPVELGPHGVILEHAQAQEDEDISKVLSITAPSILESMILLRDSSRLTTLRNISQVSSMGTHVGGRFLSAMTRVGLVVPAAELIRPYEEDVYIEVGREVNVFPSQIDTVEYVFNLSEEGEMVFRVSQAIAEQKLNLLI